MSTFNGVDLLLLLSLVAMAYLALLWHAYAMRLESRVDEHALSCHTDLHRDLQSADPYDWARDGL